MTDQQPGAPDGSGNSGHWQPVPGGGDYDPDQTMHVSFAAQLPPEPRPGEDPLGAHGPAGPQRPGGYPEQPVDASAAEAVTSWTIPVIRDEAEADSGEFSVGAFSPSWDEAPSPAPTQSFPAGMFGQGAAAAAQARAQARAAAEEGGRATGQWEMPFAGPEAGEAVPWLPAHAPAADAAWSGVVDDPESPAAPGTQPYGHPGDTSGDTARGPGGYGTPGQALDGGYGSVDDPGRPGPAGAEPYGAGAYDGGAYDGGHQDGGPYDGGPYDGGHQDGGPYTGGAYDGVEPYPEDASFGGADGAARPAAASAGSPEAAASSESVESAGGDPTGSDGLDVPGGEADPDGPDAPDGVRDPDAGPPFDPDREGGQDQEFGSAFAEDTDGAGDAALELEPEPEPVEETRSEHPLASYMLRVNGTDRPVTDAWLGESLLYVLRERLGLAGAKDGCEEGECGACSVKVDGRLVASCLVPAATAAGSEVRTVEGLTVDGRPSDVQRALADCGAVQCGFCIPGMAMTVHDLLDGNHRPSGLEVRQALSGNLCRCSGYRGVLDAVQRVVAERESAADEDPAAGDHVRVPHQGGPAAAGGPAGAASAGPAGGAA